MNTTPTSSIDTTRVAAERATGRGRRVTIVAASALALTYTPVVEEDEARGVLGEVYDQIFVWMEEDDRHARETRAQHKEATAGPEEAAAAS